MITSSAGGLASAAAGRANVEMLTSKMSSREKILRLEFNRKRLLLLSIGQLQFFQ